MTVYQYSASGGADGFAGTPSGAGDSGKAAGKFLDNDDLTKLVILPLTVSGIEGKQIFEFVKLLRREDFIINEE